MLYITRSTLKTVPMSTSVDERPLPKGVPARTLLRLFCSRMYALSSALGVMLEKYLLDGWLSPK